jgi:Protein of unknown function (DUF2829)
LCGNGFGDGVRLPADETVSQQGPFGAALEYLKGGHTICRAGWLGDFLILMTPDDDSYLPYILITYDDGTREPWAPTSDDLLENDWIML